MFQGEIQPSDTDETAMTLVNAHKATKDSLPSKTPDYQQPPNFLWTKQWVWDFPP